MNSKSRYHFADTLDQIATDALRRGVIQRSTEDETLGGREFRIDGRDLVNFSSCSYLGLERHPDLVAGCRAAAESYGTQFSSSRAFVSLGLYEELEGLLFEMFDRPAVVTASTTLGHLSALPVLVRPSDVVILDHQVHSSVQLAAQLLKGRGIETHVLPHNDMAALEELVRELKPRHEKIWYLADGVYSMYGDFAPLDELRALMEEHEQLWLYIDDAHGMSWAGERGVGYVRSRIPHLDKMVLAVSLNKAFACAGGALVFPDETLAKRVRNAGETLIFCGPIQPPMLGGAIASARVHLSDALPGYQAELADLIAHTNEVIGRFGLPQVDENESPIFFIPLGFPKLAYRLVELLLEDGYYVNSATFPAVPMHKGGVRFVVHRGLTRDDVEGLVRRIAHHYERVLEEFGSSTEKVAKTFDLAPFQVRGSEDRMSGPDAAPLEMERVTTIQDVDPDAWDARFGENGTCQYRSLAMAESVFRSDEPGRDGWRFAYITVRDETGREILRTFYTCARIKDDMFESAATSEKVEARRAQDADYLTSNAVLLGSLFTKGEHLFLDRQHPRWRDALQLLVEDMRREAEAHAASRVLLRDFSNPDEGLKDALLSIGLVELPLPQNCVVESLDWEDRDAYLSSLGQRYRYSVRKEILAREEAFRLETCPPRTREEVDACYDLYCDVHERARALNVFRLPREAFAAMCASDEYDVLRLYFTEEEALAAGHPATEPIAVMFSARSESEYQALLVGLDYRFVRSHGTYKQMLFRTLERARALGAQKLDLAFTAELEKKKIGASVVPTTGYVQLLDHFATAVLHAVAD